MIFKKPFNKLFYKFFVQKAVVALCWSSREEIPHAQWQRRNPSKMVGGANLHLESNPTPARDAQRLKHTLCTPGPRDPTETETDLCFSISCGGISQQRTASGTGALAEAELSMAWALLEEVTINPTIELSELTQDWEIDSLRAQTEPCLHQDPGERSSYPTRDWPRLACECPGVSSRGVGQWWPAAELGALSACVGPFEGGHHYLHYLHHSLAPGK